MTNVIATALRKKNAFGLSVPVTDPEELERHERSVALARRQRAGQVAGVLGNRHSRRHRFDGLPGARRPITPAERAHRKRRRAMAKASRRANRS